MNSSEKSKAELLEEVQTLLGRVTDLEAEVKGHQDQDLSVFASGPLVFFKWRSDDGWPTDYVSASVEKVLGYSPEQFLSGELPYASIISQEDVQRVADEVASHGASGVAQFEHLPYRVVRSDGVEIWVADYTVILRDDEGHITHYLGYILDITSQVEDRQELASYRKDLEGEVEKQTRALRESEEMLSVAQEITHIGSWSLDIPGNELLWSDEGYRIFGLEPQEIAATYEAFVEAVHPDDRELVGRVYAEAVKNKVPYEVVHRVVRPSGEVRVVREKSRGIVDETGKVVRMIGTVHDITEQTEAEQQIEASLEEKEILLREIHHRVKNNLQVVMSLLRLQARRISDPEAREAFADSQGRIKVIAVIHDTLSQSQSLAKISCRDYFKDLVESFEQSHRSSPARLTTDISEMTLHIDQAVPVGLIVNELVSNAMQQASSEHRVVKIKISMRPVGEDDFELSVGDDGVALPEGIDLENSDSLSLRLVARLARDQLGGTIVASRDGGSRFVIIAKRKRAGEVRP